jgi:hypothetical protein
MGIPEGKRKDTPPEKLQSAYEHLDSIGDSLREKVRTQLGQKKGKR